MGVSRKRSRMMPAANPNRAPTRGPPTMPAITASSSMMSGPAPNTRRRSSTVSSTTRNSSRINGTLARAVFMGLRQRALRLPDEHLHEVETREVDEGIDRHLVLQGSRRHGGRPHLAYGDVGREHAALQATGDGDFTAGHLGAHVHKIDRQWLMRAVAARHAHVARS